MIAADGGSEHARALGLDVAVAVGDFDSASPEAVAAAAAEGTRVVRHPATRTRPTSSSLSTSPPRSATEILVLSGDGGRLDHLLSALLLLGHERYASAQIDALVGPHASTSCAARAARGRARRARLAARAPRPCRGVRRTGSPTSSGRDARARLESRRLERVRGEPGHGVRQRGVLLAALVRRVTSEGSAQSALLLALCVGLGLPSLAVACAATTAGADEVVLVTHDVRDLGRREGGVRAGERPHAAHPAGRRRERDA